MRAAVVSHTYVEGENRGKLEALAGLGVELTVFVPSAWHEAALGRHWRVAAQRDERLEIVPVPVRRWLPSPAAALWDLQPLRQRLARRAFDIVQVEEEPWSLVARSALRYARRHHVPAVLFTWENLPGHPPWPLSVLSRGTLRLARGWIAGNQAGRDILRAVSPSRPVVVLPQLGVRLPEAPPPTSRTERDVLRVAYVGRLVEEKGVTDLIDAVAEMRSNWSLSVVGDGPARAAIEERARRRGVTDGVAFHGPLPHGRVAELWSSVDVLVLPSRTTSRWAEQFGHVIVEAMAHGVAVVGSSSGAIPGVIGDAGVVVPEADPPALCRALDGLATDRRAVDELGRRGRARVAEHYSDDAVARQTIAFWERVRAD